MNGNYLLKIWIVLILCLLCTSVPAAAQDNGCPVDVQLALQHSLEHCLQIGPDQACYGNRQVTAVPQPQVTQFVFATPGDLEAIAGLRSMTLSAMDPITDAWGIAHIRLLVTSSSLEPTDVRLVLFGDVGITNLVDQRTTLPAAVATSTFINVRQYPGRNSGVVATLAPQAQITAIGRLADHSWIRVMTADNVVGWVLASLLITDGNADTLTVETSAAPYYGPMQSFLFSSEDSGSCASAPGDGMLIQTPEGQARVSFLINEVSIDLISVRQQGGSAFVQAPPQEDMAVVVLQGEASIASAGTEYRAIAGTQVTIPMGEEQTASGPPAMPEPYDPLLVDGLVSLAIDPEMDPVPPASPEMIQAANSVVDVASDPGTSQEDNGQDSSDDLNGSGDTGDSGDNGGNDGPTVERTPLPGRTPLPIETKPPPTPTPGKEPPTATPSKPPPASPSLCNTNPCSIESAVSVQRP